MYRSDPNENPTKVIRTSFFYELADFSTTPLAQILKRWLFERRFLLFKIQTKRQYEAMQHPLFFLKKKTKHQSEEPGSCPASYYTKV